MLWKLIPDLFDLIDSRNHCSLKLVYHNDQPYPRTMKNLLLLFMLSLAGLGVGACENVQLSFLFNPSVAPAVVNYTLENANGGIETFSIEINPNGYGTTTLCLPVSCFELNFIFSNIQPADVYSITYIAGNVTETWTPNFSNNGAIENPFTFCV